jgi:PBP1b-binding outer membrane lipoprotein LpoB
MKRNPILLVAVLALAAVTLLGGCSKTQVTRVGTDTTIDLSGHWNDADSRMVADAMIADCLASPWLNRHAMAEGKNPVVIVGSVLNKTSEHIATGIFVKDLERACVVSGLVDIVASADERDQIRGERLDQRVNASPETVKQMGLELGADYMLIGTINEQGDGVSGSQIFFFSTDLELIDIQSNKKVWIGNHKIKKIKQKGRYKG